MSFSWGILSTGRIAEDFANCLQINKSKIIAVGSRSQQSADEFGKKFDIEHRHASYDLLAKDPDVDIVYIGTPHSFHFENAKLCLEHGKHVLIEKPICVNQKEAEALVKMAKAKGKFIMEGMWTRFFPASDKLRDLLFIEKAIGRVTNVFGTFGFKDDGSAPRLTRMDCAGGALLDIGVYLTAISSLAFGGFQNEFPDQFKSTAIKGPSRCDTYTSTTFQFKDGRSGSFVCSIQCSLPNEITIVGENGSVVIEAPFHAPSSLRVYAAGAPMQRFTFDKIETERKFNFGGSAGFVHEIQHVEQCLANKKTESLLMQPDETVAIAKFMDTIRKQIDLKYEQD